MIALRQCGHRFIDGNFPYGRCIPLSSSTIIIISIQFTFSPNAFFSCICHYNPAIKCICPRMQMPSLLLWCYSLERSSISLLNKPCNVCIQLYAQINLLNSSSSTILCKCNSLNIRRGTTLHNTVDSEWAVHPEYFRWCSTIAQFSFAIAMQLTQSKQGLCFIKTNIAMETIWFRKLVWAEAGCNE